MMRQIYGLLALAVAIALCPIFSNAQAGIPAKQGVITPTWEELSPTDPSGVKPIAQQRGAQPTTLEVPNFFADTLTLASGDKQTEAAVTPEQKLSKKKLEALTKRAEGSDRNAQFELAQMYLAVQSVPSIERKGMEWLRKAATQGHRVAQTELKRRLNTETIGAINSTVSNPLQNKNLVAQSDAKPSNTKSGLVEYLDYLDSHPTAASQSAIQGERVVSVLDAKAIALRSDERSVPQNAAEESALATDGNAVLNSVPDSHVGLGGLVILIASAFALMLAFGGTNRELVLKEGVASSERWKRISLDEAKKHPLYGMKSWLVFFFIAVLAGPLKGYASIFGSFSGAARSAGISFTQALFANRPLGIFLTLNLFWELATVAGICLMLFSKHRRFRPTTIFLLLSYWPMAVTLALITQPTPGVGAALATELIVWAIGSAIWVTYLQRSRRVRVTYEQCVRFDDNLNLQHVSSGIRANPESQSDIDQEAPKRTPDLHHIDEGNRNTNHAFASFATSASSVEDEAMWASAIAEFDSSNRRPGLWARAFSAADGNESLAKARYLRARVNELEAEREALASQRTLDAKRKAKELELAHLTEEERAEALRPKGMCPNCDAVIALASATCPRCRAVFGIGNSWEVAPIPGA